MKYYKNGTKEAFLLAAILILFSSFATASSAQQESLQDKEATKCFLVDTVTIYAAQGVDHNLREIPVKLISGDVDFDDTYFSAIGLGGNLPKLGEVIPMLNKTLLKNVGQGYEAVLAKHYGLQDNVELAAAYSLKTPYLEMCHLGVRFSAGIGLSYALDTPTYEQGPDDNPTKRYPLQLYDAFELEWRLDSWPRFSLITRIHHRSGAYGLIAPRHVGSNFLAIGLRYQFGN